MGQMNYKYIYVYGTNESHTCIYEVNVHIIYKYTYVYGTQMNHTTVYMK